MPRDYKLYLNDILDAIERIENYTYNINTYDEFLEQQIVQDAVIKNLMIIGEAVKKIPDEIKSKYPNSDWKKIAGFRDVLIHSYFKINLLIIWDVIENKLPYLKEDIIQILNELRNI
ncbi:DUF86 domain-containing protein [Methanothermococcus sp.]|uniref:HepT-like ribonuclease domain-containing protein n=1 Tax=Methanothermococcus sp. TaxID=2614238 RepID=UPI0025D0CC40|nr:DUF86 domain-containing protein [Methanothermococcus sp.]